MSEGLITLIPDESGGFRDSDFTDIVTNMGIQEYGETLIKKAFIEFENGAPITFFLQEYDGSPIIKENGTIKAFKGLGQFVSVAKKSGFDTQIDLTQDIFQCVPSIIGLKLEWKAKPYKFKSGGANGEEKEGVNMLLHKIHTDDVTPAQAQVKAPEPPKANDVSPDDLELIQNLCLDILTEPMQKAGIWMAIPKAVKTANPNLSKTLGLGLDMLVEGGFLSCVENKYELVG